MSAGHTPGPWVVLDDDADFGDCPFIPIETDQPTGPDCRLICEVRPEIDEGVTEVDRANARLIAAAPELLEALRTILREFCPVQTDDEYPEVIDARKAIAKATGAA